MNNFEIKLGRTLTEKEQEQLEVFYEDAKSLISIYIKQPMPVELFFIAEEIAIQRFRRIGAEAVQQESVEGVSFTYHDTLLTPYTALLDTYKTSKSGRLVAL